MRLVKNFPPNLTDLHVGRLNGDMVACLPKSITALRMYDIQLPSRPPSLPILPNLRILKLKEITNRDNAKLVPLCGTNLESLEVDDWKMIPSCSLPSLRTIKINHFLRTVPMESFFAFAPEAKDIRLLPIGGCHGFRNVSYEDMMMNLPPSVEYLETSCVLTDESTAMIRLHIPPNESDMRFPVVKKLCLSSASDITRELPSTLKSLRIESPMEFMSSVKVPSMLTNFTFIGATYADSAWFEHLPPTLTVLKIIYQKYTYGMSPPHRDHFNLPPQLKTFLSNEELPLSVIRSLPSNLRTFQCLGSNMGRDDLAKLPRTLTHLSLAKMVLENEWVPCFPQSLTFLHTWAHARRCDMKCFAMLPRRLQELRIHIDVDIDHANMKQLPKTLLVGVFKNVQGSMSSVFARREPLQKSDFWTRLQSMSILDSDIGSVVFMAIFCLLIGIVATLMYTPPPITLQRSTPVRGFA
jgi:hypothetical protein